MRKSVSLISLAIALSALVLASMAINPISTILEAMKKTRNDV